jgi:galactose mutarotase-like enzyme
MPVSLGWHPWFARPAEGDVRMRVDATGTLQLRDDLVPTGVVVPLEPATTDLRHGPALGERRLDDVYVEVGQPAELRWPDLVLRMTWDGAVQSVVVHTPPRGVTLEPQTAWPNAPLLVSQDLGQPEPRRHPAGAATTLDRSVVGLVVAAPGTPLRASTTWTWGEGTRSAAEGAGGRGSG